MSYIRAANNQNLVPEQWPGTLMADELARRRTSLDADWQRCPLTLPELITWCIFSTPPDVDAPLTSFIFAYRGFSGHNLQIAPTFLDPVRIFFQGYLRRIRVNPLGNWDG
ncbi:hypothetical protein FA95DRAFT_1612563 [Auriscalpium vulgare]|uniref:Uncharacterized protein n=1 Tax=Auriscalpium vulgare TaxID=40419 RepID=A0ACB8R5P6_9AGAM|nr:hypothetical protein FA95DRAFT_1612563 [Auriscalpium vulgare]